MNFTRDRQLDAIKGFAIVLVVIGHVTAFVNPENIKNNLLFNLIYSFHIPLFFFISGYLVFGRFGPTTFTWIKKKFRQLIVPYILFTIFYFFILFGFSINTITIKSVFRALISYTIPDSAWFLPVLFESFLILVLLINADKVIGKSSFIIFFLFVSFFLSSISLDAIPAVNQIIVYTPYVIIGYLVSSYKERVSEKNITTIELFGSLLFPILFFFKSSPFFPSINSNLFYLYYFYVEALAGIILSWVIIKSVINYKISNLFVICGIFSLEIYLTHLVILNFFTFIRWPLWFSSGIFAILSGTVVLLSLSIALSILISYNQKISIIIFGRWSFKYFKKYFEKT